jgi:RNA polymerase sigma factor (sigma-70 family)
MLGISVKNIIREDIEELTDKEARVIKMRFGFNKEEPMKLREIAKIMKMSPEGVRRIEMKALSKLKRKLVKKGIYGVLN